MNAPRYRSETRSTSVGDLPSDLRGALIAHAEKRKLKLIATSVWQTHRENPVSGSLLGKLLGKRVHAADPDAFHDMVLVVHASHLLLGTSGRHRGTSIFSLPLSLATLTRGERAADDGLSIGGFPEKGDAATSHFMGLGAGDAAEACVIAALAAVAEAKASAVAS